MSVNYYIVIINFLRIKGGGAPELPFKTHCIITCKSLRGDTPDDSGALRHGFMP